MKQPLAVDGVQGGAPPRLTSEVENPCAGYVALYEISAVLMVRNEPTADDSLADIRARIRFGMAIAAMIRMIATTISNSINEKPFCFRIYCVLAGNVAGVPRPQADSIGLGGYTQSSPREMR